MIALALSLGAALTLLGMRIGSHSGSDRQTTPEPRPASNSALPVSAPVAVEARAPVAAVVAEQTNPAAPVTVSVPAAAQRAPVGRDRGRRAAAAVAPLTDAAPVRAAAPTSASVRTGVLFVLVLPWGEVLVDGELAGRSPLTLTLPAGDHLVRIRGGQEATQHVTIVPGVRRVLSFGGDA